MPRRSLLAAITTAALALSLIPALTTTAAASPTRPVPPPALYPAVGAGTHLIDDDAKLAGFNDTDWYKANIPFLDVPDQQIEQVYYYRWRDYKEHLRYTDPQDGWISTEFLDCCGYAAPYQAIDAAAGHQITEGRWLRDSEYTDDYIKFWLTGPGASAKPQTDEDNADTSDWAHEYSFWLASAAYGQAEVTGDTGFITQLLPELIKQWHGWDKQYNAKIGLYWSVPVWDAMEYSASSYQSSDPYHGGAGYRPTLNSYQYGDAVAISKIAALAGDSRTARQFQQKAGAISTAMQKYLYDPKSKFYYHVARDDNPSLAKLDTREEIGFIPWMFDAAQPQDAAAWAQLFDPQGFAAPFGPTTAERRSPLFDHDAANCCRWDGPSWPFATSQTLTGMANLLDDYPAQPYVSAQQYADQLHTYAATQYKNGKPYVAEAHSADDDQWIYDGTDHSEDYNHSTYTDLVINGLLGLRPSTGSTLSIKPLVPAAWDHFALENVPYHGHNITVAYDRDGSHYHLGRGFFVFVDGKLALNRSGVQPVRVDVGPGVNDVPAPHLVNDAANPLRTGYPQPITSDTWQYDSAWNALDGKVWFNEVPEDTRWTNYASPNAQDYYGVDFGTPTRVSDIRWYGYDDGGGVRAAAGYQLQYWTGTAWADVPSQDRSPAAPVGNGLNRITFPALTTTKVRLLFTDPPGAYVGVSEFQSWSASNPAASISSSTAMLDGATQVPVTVTDTGRRPLVGVRVAVTAPDGWSASSARPIPLILPGHSATTVVSVTPVGPPGSVSDLNATATYLLPGSGIQSTHQRLQVRLAYPAGQQDPIGSWNFDEGSGSVAHNSAGGPDLALVNDPQWTAGQSGSAVQYNGTNQYADTSGPLVDTAGNFTVSAWVKLDSTANFATAVSQDGTTTSGFFLQYSAADGRLAFSTGEGRALADQSPATGVWYHLVGVHDANAGTYTLFVNGIKQQSVLHQASGDPSDGAFAVGRAFSGGRQSDFWPGAIDTVQLWNRALSDREAAAL